MQIAEKPMKRLLGHLKNYKTSTISSSIYAVVNKVFDMMPPFLTAWIIDTVGGQTPTWIESFSGTDDQWACIVFLGFLTAFIFGVESFFEWLYERGFLRLSQKVEHDLRMKAYNKLQNRELAFFENQRTGNLMSILNDDINQLERFLNSSFSEILHLITLFIFAGIAIFSVSPKLAVIGLLPIPFILLLSVYYQKLISPYYKQVRQTVGKLAGRLENNISGIQVVKSFTAEAFESSRVENVSNDYKEANFKAIRWASLYVPVIRIFITIGFISVFMVASYDIIFNDSDLTLGSLAFFSMMIQRVLWPVTRMGRVFDEFERAKASAARVFGLIDTKPIITDKKGAKKRTVLAGDIVLDKVMFHYDEKYPILKGLNLTIPEQKTVGIAGPTGAGKTTLIKLLMRFYDSISGEIRINGVEIRDLRLNDLRKNISVVGQEVYLFHGTIRENIAYGINNVSDGEIYNAAQKANLHDFIVSLPNGYNSIIGERGIKLSGGQRQRLSIARAILKDAPILILDEATSSVDTETEKVIQENLNQLSKGKTAIVIAHRLSTIKKADIIFVLKDGVLIEQGKHEDLVALNGVYADLWNVQIGEVR